MLMDKNFRIRVGTIKYGRLSSSKITIAINNAFQYMQERGLYCSPRARSEFPPETTDEEYDFYVSQVFRMHREDNKQLYRMEIKVLKALFIDDILNKFCFDSMFICVHYIEWSDNTWSDKNSKTCYSC